MIQKRTCSTVMVAMLVAFAPEPLKVHSQQQEPSLPSEIPEVVPAGGDNALEVQNHVGPKPKTQETKPNAASGPPTARPSSDPMSYMMSRQPYRRTLEENELSLKDAQVKIEAAKRVLRLEAELASNIESEKMELKERVNSGSATASDLRSLERDAIKQRLAQVRAEEAVTEAESAHLRLKGQQESILESIRKYEERFGENLPANQGLPVPSAMAPLQNDVRVDPSLSTNAGKLTARNREELRDQLMQQFQKEREQRKNEIEELRQRIERLEQSEKAKADNIESIIDKRLEQLLKP